ncbi:MAG: hypothetical protein HY746_03130 [Elusimicrobia bacterium]|nr:hypothetical protein [Elusimicrobiota bacterium]
MSKDSVCEIKNHLVNGLIGLLAGAFLGAIIGFLFSWNLMIRTPHDWQSFFYSCAPQLFVPVWMGSVTGLVSGLAGESFWGFIWTVTAGIGSGFFAPAVFRHLFGKYFFISFGPAAVPSSIILTFIGGMAGFFIYFSINKIIRK